MTDDLIAANAVRQVRATKREAAVLALRELSKTAAEGYTGVAAYECSDADTAMAHFLIRVAADTIDRLEATPEEPPVGECRGGDYCDEICPGSGKCGTERPQVGAGDPLCPYTHAHTRHWCGYDGCRES